MSPLARRLMVVVMLGWTAACALIGWWATGGDAVRTTPAEAMVVYDVASPGGQHSVHYLTREEAEATLPSPTAAPSPAPTRLAMPYAAPKYALNAGIGAPKRTGDTATRAQDKPRTASKGVVVLDPGHGRGDPGATHYLPDGSGRWDITEADSNLRNAELIRDDLVAMGYTVYLTRNGPGQGPGGPLPLQFITSDLYARVALASAVDADVYVAIHGNGASVKSISGPETWYCGKHAEGAQNEELARRIQRAMMDALHEYGYFPPDRGIKEDAETHHSGEFCQFVVTRETPVPAALLEFLFLSNDDDARVLVDDRAHVLMARHVADAIDGFLQERRGAP
ncbi:MAG TPA: N-acetylmuramoyl-L-alanine amidase [Dehalococcoidia bacterium]|nr:N-acetylmuramoyl-L-alanine amidase [Dehalococcoidia bacterium]